MQSFLLFTCPWLRPKSAGLSTDIYSDVAAGVCTIDSSDNNEPKYG